SLPSFTDVIPNQRGTFTDYTGDFQYKDPRLGYFLHNFSSFLAWPASAARPHTHASVWFGSSFAYRCQTRPNAFRHLRRTLVTCFFCARSQFIKRFLGVAASNQLLI